MAGCSLLTLLRDIPGNGPFVSDLDRLDFAPGSALTLHFVHWRFPPQDAFTVSPPGHPHTLCIRPSMANLSGEGGICQSDAISLVARRQTDTLFVFSVDLVGSDVCEGIETGVTVFLTQEHHIDLAISLWPMISEDREKRLTLCSRFRIACPDDSSLSEDSITPLPEGWMGQTMRLSIKTIDDASYCFYVGLVDSSDQSPSLLRGTSSATVVSGRSGPYTGKNHIPTALIGS
jgi:hypothetical protein